ncbi:LysM peptidoglycan-binding domain-containing protein [Oceanisphaera pacifica]|uniref:Peptidoglycan DD-metalloendopeptidase family protein n=1 Tax=Oceanisphaera pacifica TaxID=2818389 RepID=A0ABS3NC06_9GAMM|nr:LysM peptidoglycan-binding domain-containing protein [Oceanisphaera pacifica]MBO1518111.1 peptidoglycan DD-metalloendopeptidase family protein [Oceanisphaera pacifica]
MPKWSQILKLTCLNLVLLAMLSACSGTSPAPVSGVHARGHIKANGNRYVVAKGDTLYSIAWQAGTDVPTLARHNRIAPPYAIYPGQTLRLDIPGIKRVQYRVRRGDTLSSIARRTHHSVADLAGLNGLRPPYRIYVGQALTLKGRRVQQKNTITASAKPTAVASKVTRKANVSPSNKTENANVKKVTKPVAPATGKAYAKTQAPKKAASKTSIAWHWPTPGPVISRFSLAETGNKGVDIRGSRGQAIKAAAAGKVVYAGSALRGYGNLIIIKHNDDYLSAYAHNEVLRVKEQQTVGAGQHIADMGSSDTTDVRLHFEIRYQGASVNPIKHLPKR